MKTKNIVSFPRAISSTKILVYFLTRFVANIRTTPREDIGNFLGLSQFNI